MQSRMSGAGGRVARFSRSSRVATGAGNRYGALSGSSPPERRAGYAVSVPTAPLAASLKLHGVVAGYERGSRATRSFPPPPRTFLATVSRVVSADAVAIVARLDGDSGNIRAQTIAASFRPGPAPHFVYLAAGPATWVP